MSHTYCPKNDLIIAVWNNKLDTVKTLLTDGYDINETDSEGRTSLMIAAPSTSKAMVQLILDFKPLINSQSRDGWTALHYAVFEGKKDNVELLLSHGADPQIKNNENGFNAIEWAIIYNLYDIAQLLKKYGAQVQNEYIKGMISLFDKEKREKYNKLLEAS